MKTCKKCSKTKELTEFYKKTSSKDGYQPLCKHCSNKYNREYVKKRWATDIEFRKKRYARTVKCVNNRKIRDPEYRKKCSTLCVEYVRRRRANDPEFRKQWQTSVNNYTKKRYDNDSEHRAMRKHRAKLRKRNLKNQFDSLTPQEQNAIIQFYMNCPKGFHVDHIYPLVHGGLHCLSNLQYLLIPDNYNKRDKIPLNTNIDGTLRS